MVPQQPADGRGIPLDTAWFPPSVMLAAMLVSETFLSTAFNADQINKDINILIAPVYHTYPEDSIFGLNEHVTLTGRVPACD